MKPGKATARAPHRPTPAPRTRRVGTVRAPTAAVIRGKGDDNGSRSEWSELSGARQLVMLGDCGLPRADLPGAAAGAQYPALLSGLSPPGIGDRLPLLASPIQLPPVTSPRPASVGRHGDKRLAGRVVGQRLGDDGQVLSAEHSPVGAAPLPQPHGRS